MDEIIETLVRVPSIFAIYVRENYTKMAQLIIIFLTVFSKKLLQGFFYEL